MGMPFAIFSGMTANIRFIPLPDPDSLTCRSNGVGAFPSPFAVTLRFGMEATGPQGLDAILHARRSMLREEWTRGRGADEPLLEDALFSPDEIVWQVRPEQKSWCLQKVEELRARAHRWLVERD
jgi:hypothetical protein